MKNTRLYHLLSFLVVFITTFLCLTLSHALFESEQSQLPGNLAFDYAGSARSVALGHALVANGEGAEAVYENPAGLAWQKQHQLSMMYLNLFENTYYTFLGGSHAFLGGGALAVGWAQLSSQGFIGRDENQIQLETFNDSQNAIFVSYGNQLLKSQIKNLAWGVTLKSYSQYLFKYQQHALSLDLGAQYKLFENLAFGLHFQNITTVHLVADELKSIIPANVKTGLAWHPNTPWELLNRANILLEMDWRDIYGSQGGVSNHLDNWKVGLEYQVIDSIILRSGLQNHHMAFGLGVNIWQIQLDYAYDVRSLGGLHWMSLKYNIDKYIDPVKVDNYHQLALTAYQEEDYLKASQNWRKVMKLDPENHMARTYLNKSEQIREKRLAKLLHEVEVKVKEKDYEGAIHLLKEAAKLKSPNDDLLVRVEELEATYKKKLAKEREDRIKRHIKTAKKFEQSGKFAQALDEWEALLLLEPNHELALEKSKTLIAKISKRLEKYYSVGLKLFKKKNYPKAIKEFKRVLKIDKNHVLARFYLGKSTDIMDKMARSFYRKGNRFLNKRDYTKSLRYYNRVLEVVPDYLDVKLKIEQVKGLQKRLKSARIEVAKVNNYINKKQLNHAKKIMTPLIKADNYNYDMLQLYRRIKNDMKRSNKLYEQGIEYHQNLKYGLAVSHLERSMAINNQSPAKRLLVEIYSYQGIQAFRNGKLVEAVKIWSKGVAIDNEHTLINKYIERATNKMKFLKRIFKGAEHE